MPIYPQTPKARDVVGFEPGVADIPALREVCDYKKGDIIFVCSEEAMYYFNDTHTGDDNGVSIIKPTGIDAADPGRWIKFTTSPTAGTSRNRSAVELTGSYDGTDPVFIVPETFLHNPPGIAICVYHNGRRLRHEEFEAFESTVGGGLNRVRLLCVLPGPRNRVFADYVTAS